MTLLLLKIIYQIQIISNFRLVEILATIPKSQILCSLWVGITVDDLSSFKAPTDDQKPINVKFDYLHLNSCVDEIRHLTGFHHEQSELERSNVISVGKKIVGIFKQKDSH